VVTVVHEFEQNEAVKSVEMLSSNPKYARFGYRKRNQLIDISCGSLICLSSPTPLHPQLVGTSVNTPLSHNSWSSTSGFLTLYDDDDDNCLFFQV